jgi:hypothetical protein
VKTSKQKGRGAFATKDIEVGTVIGDYLGTIIKSDSSDEHKNGLYDMRGGLRYDILANPKKEGIHLINHSCANNCDAYPYQGHILYYAIRKIFKGEEILVNYGLGGADEKDITCNMHACHCGSKICMGTMHDDQPHYDEWYEAWEILIKKEFGPMYRKIPGKYGSQLPPLASYPTVIKNDDVRVYANIYGSEQESPGTYNDATLPPSPELRKRIRETGRRLTFPKLRLTIYGMRNEILLAESKA